MGFYERDHRSKTSFSSHHVKGIYCQHAILMLKIALILGWNNVYQVSPLRLLLSYYNLWKKITVCSQYLQIEIIFHLLEVKLNYFEFSEKVYSPNLFGYSVTYISLDFWLYALYFGLQSNATLLIFVVQVVFDLATGSSFTWLLSPLKYLHLTVFAF